MIKLVNKRTKNLADFDSLVQEWAKDYETPIEIRFTRSCTGDTYYAVDINANETMGEIEICTECETSWISIAGSIYDEDHCVHCGCERETE